MFWTGAKKRVTGLVDTANKTKPLLGDHAIPSSNSHAMFKTRTVICFLCDRSWLLLFLQQNQSLVNLESASSNEMPLQSTGKSNEMLQ